MRLSTAILTVFTILGTVLASAPAVTTATATATATAAVAGSDSSLVLTLYGGPDIANPVLAEVSLKCGPTGGTHTDAATACITLWEVGGDFDELEPLGGFCPEIFQPVTVEVGGSWENLVVSFVSTYPNQCVAADESHGVFQF